MSKNLSKRVVGASVLAVAMGMAGGAHAVAPNLLGNGYVPAPNAIELNYNSAGTPVGTPLVVGTVPVQLGYGVSAGQTYFIRFDITGATFHTAPTAAALVDSTTATVLGSSGFGTNTAAGTTGVTVASVSSSCVVFQVTGNQNANPSTGNAITDILRLTFGTVDVPSNNVAVTAAYNLVAPANQAAQAVCGTPVTGATLASAAGNIATFASSLVLSSTPYTQVADVQTSPPFTQFTNVGSTNWTGPIPNDVTVSLGKLTFGLANPIPLDYAGNAVTIAELVASGTITIQPSAGSAGSFSAATGTAPAYTGLKIGALAAAANPPVAATCTADANTPFKSLTGGTVAVFTLDKNTATGINNEDFCYTVTGTTAIPDSTPGFTATVQLTAGTGPAAPYVGGVTLQPLTGVQIGPITHNGTVLQAPWFTTYSGYISRFFLTNTGATDAPYSASFLTESGITAASGAGAKGTVKAGTSLEIDASALTTLSGGTRAAVIFDVAGPNQTIQGAYNVVNATTGSITVSPMIRPGTN